MPGPAVRAGDASGGRRGWPRRQPLADLACSPFGLSKDNSSLFLLPARTQVVACVGKAENSRNPFACSPEMNPFRRSRTQAGCISTLRNSNGRASSSRDPVLLETEHRASTPARPVSRVYASGPRNPRPTPPPNSRLLECSSHASQYYSRERNLLAFSAQGKAVVMRFLFRLDLNLHAGAEIFFWNLEFCIQTRANLLASRSSSCSSTIQSILRF